MISLVDSQTVQTELLTDRDKLLHQVELVVSQIPAVDIHTHVLPPSLSPCFFMASTTCLPTTT